MCGKNVDIRGAMIRLIECSNPDVSQVGSMREHRSSVIAPHRNATFGAAGDELALPARGGRVDIVWLCFKMSDVIKLDHSIETKGGACFALAPAAVTALHYERLGFHAITYVLAIAAAFQREWIFRLP